MSNQLVPPSPPLPPTPPGGPSAAPPSTDLSDASQRENWIKRLKLDATYPKAELLLTIGINARKAGKKIEESETTEIESIKKFYQEEIKKLFAEFLKMDKTSIASKLQEINKKANQWQRMQNGLSAFYDFLQKTVKDLKKDALQKELEKNDAEFKKHLNNKDALYKEFNDAPPDKKQEVIDKLDRAKKAIRQSTDKVDNANKHLMAALKERQARLEKEEEEKQNQKRRQEQQERRRAQGLQDLPTDLPTDLSKKTNTTLEAQESVNINRLQQALKVEEKAQLKNEILRSLYAPPPEWKNMQLPKAPKKKSVSQAIDMTGMEGDPRNRKLNLNVFTVKELDNFARFFATSENDTMDFDVTTEDGKENLQKAINGWLNTHQKATFNDCIDIATGRLIRKEGMYADNNPAKKLTTNVNLDEHVNPDYDAYLKKAAATLDQPQEAKQVQAKSEESIRDRSTTRPPFPEASSTPTSTSTPSPILRFNSQKTPPPPVVEVGSVVPPKPSSPVVVPTDEQRKLLSDLEYILDKDITEEYHERNQKKNISTAKLITLKMQGENKKRTKQIKNLSKTFLTIKENKALSPEEKAKEAYRILCDLQVEIKKEGNLFASALNQVCEDRKKQLAILCPNLTVDQDNNHKPSRQQRK